MPADIALTPLAQLAPQGVPPLKIVWTRSTVAAGPYNGLVRTNGYDMITSVNRATPGIVWTSNDGVAWQALTVPAGFEVADASRSRGLTAAIGTVPGDGGRVPAIATSGDGSSWVVTVLDLGGLGIPNGERPSHIAVSGLSIVAAVTAGPRPGQEADTSLVFTGEGGPPFAKQMNTRFPDATVSEGSQYLWWVANDLASPDEPDGLATVYGPAPPIGNVDRASLDAGWVPSGRYRGDLRHLGGRDAGEEYFSVSDMASPSSVRSIVRGAFVVLDDAIAARAFDGMAWLRSGGNSAEPAIGVGAAGLAALVSADQLGLGPTPDLGQLAVATSPNGADWHVEPIGSLLPEHGLDVTQIIVLATRILVVVTDRYPEPDGTNPAIVLIGTVTRDGQ